MIGRAVDALAQAVERAEVAAEQEHGEQKRQQVASLHSRYVVRPARVKLMNSAVAIKNTVSNANTAMAMRLAWVAKAASHPRRSVSATARSTRPHALDVGRLQAAEARSARIPRCARPDSPRETLSEHVQVSHRVVQDERHLHAGIHGAAARIALPRSCHEERQHERGQHEQG